MRLIGRRRISTSINWETVFGWECDITRMASDTHDGPTTDEIEECSETVEVNRKAVERLLEIARDSYPENAHDRKAMYTVRDKLE